MAFCSACGNQLPEEAKFCPNCGKPAGAVHTQSGQQTDGAGAAGQQSGSYRQDYRQPGGQYDAAPDADAAANKGICVLCYLSLLVLIPLLTRQHSPYVRFHSNQGLVLLILSAIISILGRIPYLGWYVIRPLGGLMVLVLTIIGIVNTLNGQKKPLPLIGNIVLFQ
jgi:uncharacterized membrane protein